MSNIADYGFGLFRIENEWLGHNGQIPGYQTFAVYSPVKDITIVVMCNLFADSQGKEPADAIGRKLIEYVTTNNI
jgi:D-alanyl-D-alanine carboxypeptidase